MSNPSKTGSRLKFLIRVVGSILALYLLYSQIDLSKSMKLLGRVDLLWILPAFVAFNLSQFISSFRLNRFFSVIGIRLTEWFNLKLYYIGMFYNLLLPGGIGGDGFKAWLLYKRSGTSLKTIIQALLSDRLNGLAAIGFWMIVIIYFMRDAIPDVYKGYLWPVILLWLAGVAIYLLIFKKFRKIAPITILLSASIQAVQLLVVYCILSALDIHINILPYLFIFLTSSVAAVLPVSIGGLGLREVVFLYGARLFGLDAEISIAASLLFFLITACSSLAGLYLHHSLKEHHWTREGFNQTVPEISA